MERPVCLTLCLLPSSEQEHVPSPPESIARSGPRPALTFKSISRKCPVTSGRAETVYWTLPRMPRGTRAGQKRKEAVRGGSCLRPAAFGGHRGQRGRQAGLALAGLRRVLSCTAPHPTGPCESSPHAALRQAPLRGRGSATRHPLALGLEPSGMVCWDTKQASSL